MSTQAADGAVRSFHQLQSSGKVTKRQLVDLIMKILVGCTDNKLLVKCQVQGESNGVLKYQEYLCSRGMDQIREEIWSVHHSFQAANADTKIVCELLKDPHSSSYMLLRTNIPTSMIFSTFVPVELCYYEAIWWHLYSSPPRSLCVSPPEASSLRLNLSWHQPTTPTWHLLPTTTVTTAVCWGVHVVFCVCAKAKL